MDQEPEFIVPSLRGAPPPARILVAEDDGEMREMVASALRNDGYDVVEASDGGELLAQLASAASAKVHDAFDLVVTDVRMPGSNGLHVLETLRRARWNVPMIVMTAFGDPQTRATVELYGGIFFDKPFDLDDLRTAVLHVLQRSSSRAPSFAAGPVVRDDPVLELVATRESGIDAWSIKWLLQAEGVQVYLGGRALTSSARTTDIYVLRRDAAAARDLIARFDRQRD